MQSETFNPSTISTRFNGLKHGAASKELFLPGENPDEFFALLDDSFRYYKPVSLEQSQLIKDLTEARWQLERRRRVHNEYSKSLHDTKPFATDWTDDDLNRLNRFDRYLTQAERSLQRALVNVRSMHAENSAPPNGSIFANSKSKNSSCNARNSNSPKPAKSASPKCTKFVKNRRQTKQLSQSAPQKTPFLRPPSHPHPRPKPNRGRQQADSPPSRQPFHWRKSTKNRRTDNPSHPS